jgi:hypothetical protein
MRDVTDRLADAMIGISNAPHSLSASASLLRHLGRLLLPAEDTQ